MRLLVTGAGGLLGGRLCRAWAEKHELCALVHTSPCKLDIDSRRLDLRDTDAIPALLEEVQPEAVIHCAAEARPAEFAREPKGARLLNVDAPAAIAAWCRRRDRRLVHCSSDTVYPGEGPLRGEHSRTAPANAYGASKLASEQAVLQALPEAEVLRLSLLYGEPLSQGNSFSRWLIDRAQAGGPVPVFHDNLRNMLAVSQLEALIERLLEIPLGGVTNVGGREGLSREAFARRLFERLDLDPGLLRPGSQDDVELPVPLPRDLRMDLSRLEDYWDGEWPGVDAGLAAEYPAA